MEGLLFYWLFWSLWVVTTFFINKHHPDRFKISVWLLFAIILSSESVSLIGFHISLTSLFMLLTAYAAIARMKGGRVLYFSVTSFIVMLAYSSFQLFALYDPVWVMFNPVYLLALLLTYLTLMLQESIRMRIYTLLTGAIHGEILYAFIIRKISFTYEIGSFSFLDTVALSFSMIIGWGAFKRFTAMFDHHFNHSEKEKHKIL